MVSNLARHTVALLLLYWRHGTGSHNRALQSIMGTLNPELVPVAIFPHFQALQQYNKPATTAMPVVGSGAHGAQRFMPRNVLPGDALAGKFRLTWAMPAVPFPPGRKLYVTSIGGPRASRRSGGNVGEMPARLPGVFHPGVISTALCLASTARWRV